MFELSPEQETMFFPYGRSKNIKRKMIAETKPGTCAIFAARWEAARLTEELLANLRISKRWPPQNYHVINPAEVSDHALRQAIEDAIGSDHPKIAGIEGWDRETLLSFDLLKDLAP